MSSSPASTVLATPTYSRSGRERKTVQKYGSMIDSDIISDPDDEAYGYYDPDDEDESFDEARVKDSDDEDEDGDGEEGDDEITVSKPIQAKQSQPKKKKSDASKTSSNKPKPPRLLLPKSAKTLAAKKGTSEPSPTTSKLSSHRGAPPGTIPCAPISIKPTQTKTSKTPSKRVLSPVASDDEAGPEEQHEAEADSPKASPEPPSKKSKTSPAKPLQLASKPLHIRASSTASTKAKSAPRPKGVSVGIVLAKKESTTSTGSKAAARGATNKGFVPLKKVEVAPAATSSKRGKTGVVLKKSGVKGTNEASAKAEMEEYDHEDQGDDVDGAQGAGDDAVGGGDAEGQDEHMSDGNDSDDGEEVSSEKKTKPKTKASTARKERGTGKTPQLPPVTPDIEDAERAPPQDMEEHVEVGQTSEVQETEEETAGNEDVAGDVDHTMSASQVDRQGVIGEPDSPSAASTPKRKFSNNSNTSNTSSSGKSSSSPRKLAPAEKIPASARDLSSQGEDMPSAKLSRHWREVLSADLKEYFRDGKAVTSPTKSASGSGSGKQKVGIKARKAIWKGVVEGYEKANWKEIEEESGISTAKLKRHLRDVMRKEVEKVIGA
ncbi:hypothetical protein EHS25_009978 [Saitozyma podzolica]|uniref:Uncharacterized protein n=1 Tax=Saitozyma podzolica TaxID=1890683 RepID=A0A427YIA3_9TREE|nr:hypothetical protein EHS25_009978 [Saitozyma podzolica]